MRYNGTQNLIDYKVTGPIIPGPYGTWQSAVASIAGGFASGVDAFPYHVEATARTKFLGKLAGNKADLGVALGELNQTLGLCGSLAKDVLDATEAAVKAGKGLPRKLAMEVLHFGKTPPKRKGQSAANYRKQVKAGRAVLNKWLEYQFGVKPLIGDIADASQALSDALLIDRVPLRMTIRGGAGYEEMSHSLAAGAFGFPQLLLAIRGNVQSRCHIAATYDIPVGTGRAFNELGLLNPASLAWELTVYSWLVDYLSNTGKWLDSLTARAGVTFVEGTITYIQKVLSMEARVLINPAHLDYQLLEPVEWQVVRLWSCGQMRRDVLTDVFPAYRPTVRNRLNATKVANVLSVLALNARIS
jgi:hypothetical protein